MSRPSDIASIPVPPVVAPAHPRSVGGLLRQVPAYIVGGAFVLSGVPKAVMPDEFVRNIMAYDIVGVGCAKAVAIYLPYLELVIGLCLLGGAAVVAAFGWSVVLLAAFVALQLVTLWRGIHVACGCFSLAHAATPLGWVTVVRTALLLAVAIVGWRVGRWSTHTGGARGAEGTQAELPAGGEP